MWCQTRQIRVSRLWRAAWRLLIEVSDRPALVQEEST